MNREDLGNGAEYIDGPHIGILRRSLTAARRKKLETYLCDARSPSKYGLSGKERWVLYSLAWKVIDANDLATLRWADIDFANRRINAKSGGVVIPKKLSAQLNQMWGDDADGDERVFPELRDAESPVSTVNEMLESDCLKAKLDLPTSEHLSLGEDKCTRA